MMFLSHVKPLNVTGHAQTERLRDARVNSWGLWKAKNVNLKNSRVLALLAFHRELCEVMSHRRVFNPPGLRDIMQWGDYLPCQLCKRRLAAKGWCTVAALLLQSPVCPWRLPCYLSNTGPARLSYGFIYIYIVILQTLLSKATYNWGIHKVILLEEANRQRKCS